MKKTISKLLILSGLLCVSLNNGMVYSQTPYWDSSGGDQSYFSPGNPNSGNYNQNNSQGGGYNQQNSPQNYGQPSYGEYGNYGGSSYGQAPLKGYVATAPAGTSMFVTTTTYISSDSSHIRDPISVTLGYDLAMGGNILLPGGTQIQGEVVSVIPAGRTGRHGEVQLKFNRAMLPDGRQIPLSARLITEDGTGIIRGGTRGQRLGGVAKNTLGGAAVGAASGAALGAIINKNKWNEGLLWGSILGAGGGLARSGIQRGEEAQIHPGTQFQIMLDQPLTINSTAGGGQNPSYNTNEYPY